MYQSPKRHWRKRLIGQMVNIVSNCDLDLAKELSAIEKEIFSTSWDPSWIRDSINNKKAIYWVKKEENKMNKPEKRLITEENQRVFRQWITDWSEEFERQRNQDDTEIAEVQDLE